MVAKAAVSRWTGELIYILPVNCRQIQYTVNLSHLKMMDLDLLYALVYSDVACVANADKRTIVCESLAGSFKVLLTDGPVSSK